MITPPCVAEMTLILGQTNTVFTWESQSTIKNRGFYLKFKVISTFACEGGRSRLDVPHRNEQLSLPKVFDPMRCFQNILSNKLNWSTLHTYKNEKGRKS